jgi:hypothetical protein
MPTFKYDGRTFRHLTAISHQKETKPGRKNFYWHFDAFEQTIVEASHLRDKNPADTCGNRNNLILFTVTLVVGLKRRNISFGFRCISAATIRDARIIRITAGAALKSASAGVITAISTLTWDRDQMAIR